ncbi:MAG: 4-hydroxythreonine-4-phosphate dehydrogenase [Chlorobi bacterium OLB4]|jgi:4-hydroxythreonine-4-phosphate dehydrogenase|nr:MAG: 4-hydroxythreonine-4-phosphate dehydrogenase [Chlorobi bacterium OLB4]MBV6397870.1 D-threonate 4-phosphate dehydrogenase [Ignavibacteria bacterium]
MLKLPELLMNNTGQYLILTSGDPNGIGPEIILKLFKKRKFSDRPVLIAGFKDTFDFYSGLLNLPEIEGKYFLNRGAPSKFKPKPGKILKSAGEIAASSIFEAIDFSKVHPESAIITLPISKEAINLAGVKFPGHTELFEKSYNSTNVAMIFYSDTFMVSSLTGHIPLRKISGSISKKFIIEKLMFLTDSLKRDFKIENPTLAILGLNPHCGDGGITGNEETDTIIPALKLLRTKGIDVAGPFSADGFFATQSQYKYSLVISCYHDQGLIPFKMLQSHDGVNFTAGLPVVRTSPDHGTAFDIAGKGLANISSTQSAFNLAIKISSNRRDQIR